MLYTAVAAGSAGGDSGGASVVDGATPLSVASSPSSAAAVQPRRRGRPRKAVAAPDDSITAAATKSAHKKRESQTVIASSSVVVETDKTAVGTSRRAENAVIPRRRGRPRLNNTLKKLPPVMVEGAMLTPREARELDDAQASYEAARQAAILRRAEIIAAAEAAAKMAAAQHRTKHPTPPPSWSLQEEAPPLTATTTTNPAAVVGSDFGGRVADSASGLTGVAYARAAAGLPPIGLSVFHVNMTNDEWLESYDLPARNPVVEVAESAAVDVVDDGDGDPEDAAAAKRRQMAEIEFKDDVETVDGDVVEGQADESRILGVNDAAIFGSEASNLAVNATALAEEEAEQDRQQAAIQVCGFISRIGG